MTQEDTRIYSPCIEKLNADVKNYSRMGHCAENTVRTLVTVNCGPHYSVLGWVIWQDASASLGISP